MPPAKRKRAAKSNKGGPKASKKNTLLSPSTTNEIDNTSAQAHEESGRNKSDLESPSFPLAVPVEPVVHETQPGSANVSDDDEGHDDQANVKVKKPRIFKLREDSALASNSQHGRPSRKMPAVTDQSSSETKGEKTSASDTSATKGKSKGPGRNLDHSDIDKPELESLNDSDAASFAHSADVRNTSVPAISYLDSFPEIPDTGLRLNKAIQNDPFKLDEKMIDPLLREYHKSLPTLRNSAVIPFVRYGSRQPEPDENVCLAYQNIVRNIVAGSAGASQLDSAVNFTYSIPFLNPSRAPPDLVVYENGRICFKGDNMKLGKNAVFLTTGLLFESQLKEAVDSIISPGYKIRQVRLLPFGGEMERLLAYIGTVFDTDVYVSLLESGCLIVTTRREGAGGDYNNNANSGSTSASRSPVRPKVPAGLLTSSPVKLGPSANQNKGRSSHFHASLGFKDDVPVYDLREREQFSFRQDSLKHISDLPAYDGGETDITPCKYIATVGYTVGSWNTKLPDGESKPCASLNIQFVIILGKVDMEKLV